jgi:uncharacterized repeat protein (TIGR02543 family)
MTKDGYILEGWYREEAFTTPWDFGTDTVSGDITLYAKWLITYTVSFESNGGSTIASQIVNLGGLAEKPADPSKSDINSKLVNWYKEPDLTNIWDFTNDTVTDNITLYAKWDAYSLGDTGPGGGIIFYRNDTGFTMYQTATDTTGITAYYFEAAPTGFILKMWSLVYPGSASFIGGTETGIGTGRRNTAIILKKETNSAAGDCARLTTGGKTDWFLPSKDELNQLYINRSVVVNLEWSVYWSSSEIQSNLAYNQNVQTGNSLSGVKDTKYHVRAIRAF